MRVLANGFPKSGNHALVKALQLLGVPCEVNHRSHRDGLPDGVTHHIFVKRDPRNVIISWLRFNGQPVTPGTFIAAFRRFQGRPLVDEMLEFEPWLDVDGAKVSTYVVRYEDLTASDEEMRSIAAFIGVPYIDGAWENLPNHTVTWNAEHSDYRKLWPQVEHVWNNEGGDYLAARWGY